MVTGRFNAGGNPAMDKHPNCGSRNTSYRFKKRGELRHNQRLGTMQTLLKLAKLPKLSEVIQLSCLFSFLTT